MHRRAVPCLAIATTGVLSLSTNTKGSTMYARIIVITALLVATSATLFSDDSAVGPLDVDFVVQEAVPTEFIAESTKEVSPRHHCLYFCCTVERSAKAPQPYHD